MKRAFLLPAAVLAASLFVGQPAWAQEAQEPPQGEGALRREWLTATHVDRACLV
jgi:hypothetical protein